MENKKPKMFLVLKILGFSVLVIGIILIILSLTALKQEDGPMFGILMPGIFLAMSCLPMLFIGFSDKIAKVSIAMATHIQEENKDKLKTMTSTRADIASDAVKTTARAAKEGFVGEKMFCKYCGSEIDNDSIFCKACGKKQN